jgi:hypothetical protein
MLSGISSAQRFSISEPTAYFEYQQRTLWFQLSDMIPDFVDELNLAPGGHRCSIDEVQARFGQGQARMHLYAKLTRLMECAKKCGFLYVLLGGSFATAKESPGDLDITWFGPCGMNKHNVESDCADLMDGSTSKERFGCDMLFIPLEPTQPDQLDFWGRQLGFDTKTSKERGTLILELI